jgi:NAD(P)-dependent dehydrogenase (short-subunit alcohol dehydrogenase family)
MDSQIRGKLAYVNAGAYGIGEAVANLLTREGASVIVGDKNEAVLEEKAHRWTGTVAADLATAAGADYAVSYVLRTFGRAPDILINNLGVGEAGSFEDLSDQHWARSFEINLMGCVRMCRAFVPGMAAQGDAAIVNTGSDLAKQPEPGLMDYGVCKAGLLYLTKALAKQYAPQVRVNAVLPGPVWTRMWTRPGGIVDQLVQKYGVGDRDAALKRFLEDRYLPLGIGQAEDVANAVVFLASPLAKYITGAALDIGGTLRGLI